MHLKASYTIEAAYVMAITLFAIAFGIKFAYAQRDKTLEAIISHEAQEEASHIEETYDPQASDIQSIEAYTYNRMRGVGRLSSSTISIDRGRNKTTISVDGAGGSYIISSDIHDPEDWMRKITSVKEWIDTVSDN